jgi:subtilisin family serine protease
MPIHPGTPRNVALLTRRTRHALLALVGVATLAFPCGASAARALQRLDPRLSSALVPGSDPVPVWVDFVDKGEQGSSDLQRRLGEAERRLTPESRARRIRAEVTPLVDYLDLPVEPAYLDALAGAGFGPYGASRWLNGCCVRTSGARLTALAELDFVARVSPAQLARTRRPEPAQAEASPGPELARPIGPASAAGTPAFYGQTYTQLQRLGVPAVHDSGYVGTGVLVAVFDEGFNHYTRHEATRTIDVGSRTRDFVGDGIGLQDTLGAFGSHGQYTLSCLGGNAPNVYVGPAYGARFALARTENSYSEKPVEMVNWLRAAEWADSLGADVISSSLGYFAFPDSAGGAFDITYPMLDGHTTIITRAAEIAAAKGIIVVNSAGNTGPSPRTLDAPADASGDSVLAVGAVDSLGAMAGFSSRGPTADGRIKPDLCAQGRSVLLASASGSTNTYVRSSGTSFACPLTAGLVACLISARPNWTPRTLIRGMKLTASRSSSPNNDYGWGIPNGLEVLRWAPDSAGVPGGPAPLYFTLLSANPMTAGTAADIRFGLSPGAAVAEARLDIYDLTGRRVRTLWSGTLVPGLPRHALWDGTDANGRARPSGIYFVSLDAGGHRAVLRLVTIR